MAQPYVPSNEPGQPYAQSGQAYGTPQQDTGAPPTQQGAPYHPQPQYQAAPAGEIPPVQPVLRDWQVTWSIEIVSHLQHMPEHLIGLLMQSKAKSLRKVHASVRFWQ